MALDRIKGITIKVGADTTELTKALKDVDKQLGTMQKSLKDVNQLLKLDPGNTDLLRQKQKQLSDSINTTKQRLQELKTAQKGVKEGSAEWDAIQREIIDTENKLKSLEKEYKDFGSVAKQELLAVGQQMQDLGAKVGAVGDSMIQFGRNYTTRITLPIVGVGTAAVKSAADYERAMAKVKSVTSATDDEFEALQAQIENLASTTEFTAEEVADAAYYMGMAGWNATDMIAGLPGVLSLSVAGGTDLARTSDIVTDSLTAFGLGAKDTEHFVNVLAQASRESNTNVDLMGESFKYVAPLAGRMGYSIDDVATALGILANNGIKGSMAGTALRNILQRLADPTEKVEKSMDALHISLLNDEKEAYTFGELLDLLRASLGGLNINTLEYNRSVSALTAEFNKGKMTEEEYEQGLQAAADALANATEQTEGQANAEKIRQAAILAGARGMPALLAIVGTTTEEYSKLTNAIHNTGDAAEEMAAIQRDTLTGQLNVLKGQIAMLGVEFGNILVPVIREVVKWLQGVVKVLNGLDDKTKERIIKIAAIVAAVGPLIMLLGGIVKVISSIITIGGVLIKGIGLLMGVLSPTTLIIAAIAAAVIALTVVIVKNWDTIKAATTKAWESIKTVSQRVWSGITAYISNAVRNQVSVVTTAFNNMTDRIRNRLDRVRNIAQTVVDAVTRIFRGAHWELPRIKLPHFSVSEGKTILGITLPKVSVEWYRKAYENPYLFTSPTVVNGRGFGDGGGSGELVYGRDALMRDIAQVSQGNITVNVYAAEGMDVNQLADKIQNRLAQVQRQRMMAYA